MTTSGRHLFRVKDSLLIPQVSAMAIAGNHLSLYSHKLGKEFSFEPGQLSLVIALQYPENPRRGNMTLLVNQQAVEVPSYEQDRFIYAKPNDSLEGKSLCITGALQFLREAYVTLIKAHGGTYKSSMSNGVDYLITENPHVMTTKMRKAKSAGIQIISEQEFFDLLK